MKRKQHFLITCLPAQGHLNPTLQLAKSLARTGTQVTFATTIYGLSRIKNPPAINGLSYASFSDGYDDEESRKNIKFDARFGELTRIGSQNLTKLIQTLSNEEDRQVSFLIYGIMMPWAADVACEMHIPSAFLAFQSATAFAIYHKYFNGKDGFYDGVREIQPSISISLPDLPLFENRDLPSMLIPTDPYFASSVRIFHEHVRALEKDTKPCVLVNTFNELEEASVKAVDDMKVIPIGPLIPSAFSDGNDPTDKSVGCDLFESPKDDYFQWLDSKKERSVIYVSFGSLVMLKKEEKIEILCGLEETRRSYLMVIRNSENKEEEEVKEMMENGVNGEGMIVPWCSQMEVLCHKSIGCFVTHCGWNSILESIVAGVPIVGCPHFSDQLTNAKMIEEVWGNGVRARANEDGVVERGEIKRCVDILMGGEEKGEEIRKNAGKWRCLALEAVKENGSSNKNLKSFLGSLE